MYSILRKILLGGLLSFLPLQAVFAVTANDDLVSVNVGQQVTIDVLANDSGSNLSIYEVDSVWTGNISIVNNQLIYNASGSYVGDMEVWYGTMDPNGDDDWAMVTISINGSSTGVTANDDVASVNIGQQVTIDVLANDTGSNLSIYEVDSVWTGSISIVNNHLVYNASGSYVGDMEVWYGTMDSNGNDDWAMALITINPASTTNNWWKPSPTEGLTWQWQLQGTVDTTFNVDVYDIDLFDTPTSTIQQLQASGKKVICYFSAGSYENWRSDQGQFNSTDLGEPLEGWAGERWLDIRSTNVRNIMKSRMDLAVQKGCDGVEPDNVDGYSNPNGLGLTASNQLNYNRFLASQAHARNLSVGLKNDIEQLTDLVSDFDWALNEQCFEFNECDNYDVFMAANKAVFGVEYYKDPNVFCPIANSKNFSWLKKNDNLDIWRVGCEDY